MNKFVERHDIKIHRLLETVPGFLTWALILSPFWLGLIAPAVLIFYITFLTVFWVYMAMKHSIGVIAGYGKYRKEMAMNWIEECNKLNFSELPDKATLPSSLGKVRHFILIPAVNEPYEVLKGCIESLVAQTFPTQQITLVFTIEEEFGEDVTKRIYEILGDNVNKFEEVLIYTHPAGIEGEALGVAGANRTWGAKHAIEHMRLAGKFIRNYIFTTIDADHVLDPQFISRLTHLYLTSDRRDYKFYSTALHLFNNNIWDVPTLMRIEANSVTLAGLSDWIVTNPSMKDTFSNYSSSLQTLIDADYWDVQLGVDDTLFYWRAFFARNGDFSGACHFIPYSADAVQADSYVKSHKSMYKQLLRWGWGAVAFPVSIKGFMSKKAVPFPIKMLWTLKHIEKKVIALNTVYLMTFGITLITLINPEARQLNFTYRLPDVMSVILTFALVFLIPITIFRTRIVKPIPADWPIWRKVFVLLEGPMVVVNLFTFSFIPFIEAQTRMLLGYRMKDLYHTPKVRHK